MPDLTIAQAARELGLSPKTLRAQVYLGRLETTLVTEPTGRTYRLVSEEEVERYRRQSLDQPGPKR